MYYIIIQICIFHVTHIIFGTSSDFKATEKVRPIAAQRMSDRLSHEQFSPG